MAPPPTRYSAVSPCFHGCLAFFHLMSHHNLRPHIPSIHLSAVNSSPHPGIAPQSLKSSSQLLLLWGETVTAQGIYGCVKDYLILIPFRLPQTSCFTLSLECFSSDSDNCPAVRIRLLLHFPHLPRTGPVLLTLLFFPLVPPSYWVLRSSIYSFPLVRYACPLSAGVLHALLCLKVCFWCTHGERCTPHPPTPPPSCSPLTWLFDHSLASRCKDLLRFWVASSWELVAQLSFKT